jgi:DNA-binding GntR family transcriptional regulator
MARIIDEHRAIVAAVEAGDPERAEALIERHLEETLRLLRRSSAAAAAPQSSSG